ncbi:hypothetical protein SAPIO_CDS1444 [Scedosporium apiospermum]|uniref:Alpha-type protein kinase domain-containing protein n=1 Tax=Pseudallescheria apiosperma TaxID=563466 RepID=A0A084GEB2_PSEDA|nr:uncharacterized protein SAPIO_CDS1444 [Scedosporium apiospermum]KEZ45674.1 hypothetical protein SAPIO_CDS1444 [Scedosporium apiospermum]
MSGNPLLPAAASVARSQFAPEDLHSRANAMLRASLASGDIGESSHTPQSSITSSQPSRDSLRSRAKAMFRASFSRGDPRASSSTTRLSKSPPRTMERIEAGDALPSLPPSYVTEAEYQIVQAPSSPPPTTTSTMMRMKYEQALVEKREAERVAADLRREADLGPSELVAEKRVLELKYEALKAKKAASVRSGSGTELFKKAYSTDVLFLMDTTSSMLSHIKAAKDQIKSIVTSIKTAFMDVADLRVAIVGYRDHEDDPNIEFLDFTRDTNEMRRFLSGLEATGGGDTPEDVLGGIQQALKANWQSQTRVIIHIADAPPHGRDLNDLEEGEDDYPNPGSEPHRLTYEKLIKQMIKFNIHYTLLRIHKFTDRMAHAFFQVYAAASGGAYCKLHPSNVFYGRPSGTTEASRNTTTATAVQFQELELGISLHDLKGLVLQSVTTSASIVGTHLAALSTSRALIPRLFGPSSVRLETTPPRWDEEGWLDQTLVVEAYFPDVVIDGRVYLDDMMKDDENIKITTTNLTIHMRSRPFDQGAIRFASYARTEASTNKLVVKTFKDGGKKKLAHLVEDMRCQALCKAFAFEFNALLKLEYSLDFVIAACLKPKGPGSSGKLMSLEPFIKGNYIKYSSNFGFVADLPGDKINMAAQAFSHFTFERSRGNFLTRDPRQFGLSETNAGESGIMAFFATHKCNSICRKLGLRSDKTWRELIVVKRAHETAVMIYSKSGFTVSTIPVLHNAVKSIIFRCAELLMAFFIYKVFSFFAARSNQFTSYLMFAEDYIQRLLFLTNRGLSRAGLIVFFK